MGAGRYVGRVGALAVALGVGFGVSSAVTVAVADTSSSPGSPSNEASRSDARRAGAPGARRPARPGSRPASSAGRGPGSRSVPVPVAADLQRTAAAPRAAAMPMPAADAGDGDSVLPAAVVDLDEQLDTATLALTVAVSAAEAMPDSSAEPTVGEVPLVEEPKVPLPAPASAVAVAAPVTDAVDSTQPDGLAASPIAPLETSVAFAVLAWSRKEFETATSPAGLATPADPQPTTSLIVPDSSAPAPAAAVGASQASATPAAVAAAVEATNAAVTATATGVPDLFGIIQSFFTGIINAIQGIFNAVAKIFGFGAPATPVNHAPTASAPALGTPSASTGAVKVTIAASDADGDPLSYTVSAGPAKGTLSAITNGVLTYTPTAAARSKAALSTATAADKQDTFTITVSDGAGGAVAVPVTVTVLAAAPVNHANLQTYTAFEGYKLNLYMYKGNKVAILADSDDLDATTMANWLAAMDGAYNFYSLATGQEPFFLTDATYIDGRSTIARVDSTCGAGCGYLGATGIEMLNNTFDSFYSQLMDSNQYDQVPFYELGRNFWFYSEKLEYKVDDPIVTGYAVFMRFAAIDYLGLAGAPFNGYLPYVDFENDIRALTNRYLANPALNWANTLGVGKGVPNSGWGATDLFASFCFYLQDTYGATWVFDVWKNAAARPDASTTQDAVDNFVVAASQAANTDLIPLFNYWRWPVSQTATDEIRALGFDSAWQQDPIK